MKHSIRKATPQDTKALSALHLECLRSADWFPAELKSDLDFVRDTEGEEIWVALDEHNWPIGFVSVWMSDSFIHHLYISESARGQRVGSALLAALAGQVPLPWRLKCAQSNARARDFYAARGWQIIETGEGKDGSYWLMECAPSNEPEA